MSEPIKPPGKWVERVKSDSSFSSGRDYTKLTWLDGPSSFEAWQWRQPEELRISTDTCLSLEEFKELSALFLQRVEQVFEKEGAKVLDLMAALRSALVVCTVCKRQKPPVGRDVAPEMAGSYCEHECPGRQLPPYPGRLWPGEEAEELGL